MTVQTIIPPRAADHTAVTGAFKVDVSRGGRDGRVSSEWFSRPDDQRFLNLDDLFAHVAARRERSRTRTVETKAIQVRADRGSSDLTLALPGGGEAAPTHYGFGQLATRLGVPAAYLRTLPAPIAAINLQYALATHRAEQVKTYEVDGGRADGTPELWAATGPDYGRIHDAELVAAVQKIAGNGVGETRWKVPGVLNWSNGTYNPFVDVTKETTTLYASDRDAFVFLVDDTHPIEAGKLADGSPDLYFRGFYAWNSEVGSRSLGIATFYLRGVCQNRNLWGVEEFEKVLVRHSKFAGDRFAREAAPALEHYADASPSGFVAGIKAAKELVVARNDEERLDFLAQKKNGGFSKAEADRIIATVLREEGSPPESVYDFVNGLTAIARTKTHQDARLNLEQVAKRLLDRASA